MRLRLCGVLHFTLDGLGIRHQRRKAGVFELPQGWWTVQDAGSSSTSREWKRPRSSLILLPLTVLCKVSVGSCRVSD
jgi:hypothetical protein